MIEFLSILNEDLNKTGKKKYIELKEKEDNETELECAKRFRKMYLQRNNSIITDFFSGLLKSEVICNNRISFIFSSFNYNTHLYQN